VAALLMLLFPSLRSGLPLAELSNPFVSSDARSGHAGWNGPVSYATAVERAAPSVVNIYTTKMADSDASRTRHPLLQRRLAQRQQPQLTLGSGVIMRRSGYILTNHHVVQGAEEIVILTHDGRQAAAELIGSDPESDLAVLRIQLAGLAPIVVGEPSRARIGDVVLAIGNPLGFGQAVTQGIISATGRNGLGLNTFENFIQTDADINPGNSGGAVVDAEGRLLGISTANLNQNGTNGISFAIPADTAEQVMSELISHGRVVRGWLGFEASPLPPQVVQRLQLPFATGLLVNNVASDGPAEQAGLQPDDIVISLNGAAIADPQSGIATISALLPGSSLQLGVWRSGRQLQLEATTGTRPQF
jgi:serine protease DegS